MLRALSIRDYVIVERLDLELASGFTALTGETGAGKSILVDALGLALGGRADAGIVRAGASRAEVSADFDIDALPAVRDWLAAREWAEDQAEHRRLGHAQELIAAVTECADALDESDDSATARLAHAAARLAHAAELDPALDEAKRDAETAGVHASEAAQSLRRYLQRLDVDPARLSQLDARIRAVMDAARRHRVEPAALPDALAERKARMAELGGEESLEKLREQEAPGEGGERGARARLSQARRAAAKKLGAEGTKTMQPLA